MAATSDAGAVARDGDRYALNFEREYPAPIDDVWDAIVTPERAARWIGDLRGTLAVGEKVVLVMGDDEQTDRADLDIRECRPPQRLMVGWTFPGTDPTTLTVDLLPVGPERTLVRMSHTGWRRDEVPGYGCGWQHFVDALGAHLADVHRRRSTRTTPRCSTTGGDASTPSGDRSIPAAGRGRFRMLGAA